MYNYINDVVALALNIYYEARGESDAGKIAVALCTRNRVKDKRWPNTYMEVVWQRKQFSWTNEYHAERDKDETLSTPKRKEAVQYDAIVAVKEHDVFKKCLEIAAAVARDSIEDYTGGANHYLNLKEAVDVDWDDKMKVVLVIGKHTFYKG